MSQMIVTIDISKLAHKPDDDSLNPQVGRRYSDRLHARIGGLQADILSLGKESFQRRFVTDQSYNHLAGDGFLSTGHDDQISILNAFVDHGISDDLQHIVIVTASIPSQ
jgi:hypothetical protein